MIMRAESGRGAAEIGGGRRIVMIAISRPVGSIEEAVIVIAPADGSTVTIAIGKAKRITHTN